MCWKIETQNYNALYKTPNYKFFDVLETRDTTFKYYMRFWLILSELLQR